MDIKMKTKEELEKEIEELEQIGRYELIDKGYKNMETEIKLKISQAKLQQHNEDLKMFEEEQKRKVEKLKRFVNGRNGEDENGESKECICDICQIAREINKIFNPQKKGEGK